jgi:glycerophosphoryl diester phosphodiesterase
VPGLELPPSPWIVGHRGAAGEACENTVEAFRRGLAAGVDMIELDVQLAADGVLICCHDWDLKRLGNRPEAIEEEPSSVLTDIPLPVDETAGGAVDPAFLPTFGEALAAIPEPMPLNVELKRQHASAEALVRTALDALDGRSQVLVSSYDWGMLEEVRRLMPDLPLAPRSHPRTMRPQAPDQPGDLIAAGTSLGAFSLNCPRRMVSRQFIERAAAAGFRTTLSYTVNDPQEAERFFAAGLTGVFTDVPTTMLEHFRGVEDSREQRRATPE